MDIGTAKLEPARRSVPYHCLDLVAPGEDFNAALYQRFARAAISDICGRGRLPVLCGGSGLYLRAALDDFDLNAGERPVDVDLRRSLEREAAQSGASAFHARLAAIDPKSAALIHPNNVRRVVRAFELLRQGRSYASQSADFSKYKAFYSAIWIGLDCNREVLYELINKRVDTMMAQGLLAEVERLVDAGFKQALTAMQAIGYKEMIAYLDGRCSLDEAIEDVKRATRRYAKRQMSWFKRDARIRWIDVSDLHAAMLAGGANKGGGGLDLGRELLARAMLLLQ
jgi:tRNA dimethylallyltransferase